MTSQFIKIQESNGKLLTKKDLSLEIFLIIKQQFLAIRLPFSVVSRITLRPKKLMSSIQTSSHGVSLSNLETSRNQEMTIRCHKLMRHHS